MVTDTNTITKDNCSTCTTLKISTEKTEKSIVGKFPFISKQQQYGFKHGWCLINASRRSKVCVFANFTSRKNHTIRISQTSSSSCLIFWQSLLSKFAKVDWVLLGISLTSLELILKKWPRWRNYISRLIYHGNNHRVLCSNSNDTGWAHNF